MASNAPAPDKGAIIKDCRTTLLNLLPPPAPGVPVAGGIAIQTDRPSDVWMLEIETADGTIGMGYAYWRSIGIRTVDACFHEVIKPLLIGQDATHIERLWREAWKSTYRIGRMGVPVIAFSIVDVALWDWLGKRAGLPLYRLWGASREAIPAYGSGVYRWLDLEGQIAKAKGYVAAGLQGIKMQAAHGHSVAHDVEMLRRMREALGPDVKIMIDVNQGWSADTAILAGRQFEPYDPYWLEEPVPVDDFAGYFRVARALKLRVVGGESHFMRWELRPFFTGDVPIPILQPDVIRGGLTELRKIAAVADTWHVQIAPHLYHELMVSLCAHIPNALILEYRGWIDDLWVEPVKADRQGLMRPIEKPGHGLAFKPEAIKEFRVRG
ncbi:MAG: mandelate racemase/muconate lactonizing enzyme family protein [Candidatus Lambdaproteobacteria bacterium]|nr:mandelate racemase/muconate lactonizing enzyme family protein [Candidatus Lambdaproteobacteria bacterium]